MKGLNFYETIILLDNLLLDPPARHSHGSSNEVFKFMEKLDRN